MKRVIAVHTLFDSQPDGPVHRRMRRGAGGGGPSFWATQFFGQRRSFFWAAAMVGGGCFSIFRRADDVTRTMSKGGGVLVKSPPSGNPVSAPAICVKFWPINPSAPLTKAFPYAYGPVHVCMCVYIYVCMFIL